MRQPLEDKIVTIARTKGSLPFPANLMQVGALTPCPCGNWGDPSHDCTCSPATVTRYQKRISGLLLDRVQTNFWNSKTMEPQSFFFLALILFAGFFCLAVLVFGVFVVIFITRVSSFGKTVTAELPVPPAEEFLAMAELRPWEPRAFTDLSCRWKGDWRDLTRLGRYQGYTRGVVRSLRDPDGIGWLAFTVDSDHRQERQGSIVLRSSVQRVELKVEGQRLNPNVQVQAWVDGKPWGYIAVTYPGCLYRSADGTTEARWTPVFRPKHAWVLNKLIVSDPDYFPLTVNARPVGALADMWIRNPRVGAAKPLPAALQSVRDDLTAQEQGILLIMLGMSLYFDTLHIQRVREDW